MSAPALKPVTSRVAFFYLAFFLAIIGPTLTGLLIGVFGPPPFTLDAEILHSGWADEVRTFEGATVETKLFANAEAAKERAKRYVASVTRSRYSKTLNEHRFVDDSSGRHVLVSSLDSTLIRIEGPDREHVDSVYGRLPFLIENPNRNPIYVLMTEYLGLFFAGFVAYLLLLTLFLFRGGAWAATIEPAAGVTPIPAAELRRRLLEVNRLDAPIQVGENRRERLVAEWRLADSKWRSVFSRAGLRIAHSLEMELDASTSTIRLVEASRVLSWHAGVPRASFNFSFFRGIIFYQAEAGSSFGLLRVPEGWRFDEAYSYRYSANELKHPVVAAIVESGWSVRPVISFFRLLSG